MSHMELFHTKIRHSENIKMREHRKIMTTAYADLMLKIDKAGAHDKVEKYVFQNSTETILALVVTFED